MMVVKYHPSENLLPSAKLPVLYVITSHEDLAAPLIPDMLAAVASLLLQHMRESIVNALLALMARTSRAKRLLLFCR